MQNEYDFSNAERGKFYQFDATHQLPVYLEPEVLSYFTEKAKNNGVELNTLINELLKKDIDHIEGVKKSKHHSNATGAHGSARKPHG